MYLSGILLYSQADGGAADDMARVGEQYLYVLVDGMPRIVFYGIKMLHGIDGILLCIQRFQIRQSLQGPLLIGVFDFVFLYGNW